MAYSTLLEVRLSDVTPWLLPSLNLTELGVPAPVQPPDLRNVARVAQFMWLMPVATYSAGAYSVAFGSTSTYPEDDALARFQALKEAFAYAGLQDPVKAAKMLMSSFLNQLTPETLV